MPDASVFILLCAVAAIWMLPDILRGVWRSWTRRSVRVDRIVLGDLEMGMVYVCRDKGHPGIVKIGYSTRFWTARQREISRDMAGGNAVVQIFAVDHIPFPRAVERVAHRIMARRRVRWPAGSTRGREWFHAKGEKGEARAIRAVERAAGLVRIAARRRRPSRWPADADMRVTVWKLCWDGVQRYRLFR